MGCEMEIDESEDMDVVLGSMWPEDINEAGSQFNVEIPAADQDMLKQVKINKIENAVDVKHLMKLTNYSDKGNWQLTNLVKNFEYKHSNAARLLKEELDNLTRQQQEVQLKKLEIIEEHRFEQENYGSDKRPITVLDDSLKYLYTDDVPRRRHNVVFQDEKVDIDAEYDTIVYWKQRALHLEKLLESSMRREELLKEKLLESIETLESQSSPVEELAEVLKRADNFLHFVLQNAPVVIGHQDKDLRYRFIFNHFPSLSEKDIIGKTDVEIFSGPGVKESQDFKQEVLERRRAAKREITFETELFGLKTFLIYAEPVFNTDDEAIGVNYMGMEVTDQVIKREKMAKLREEMAVQKAKETELNKTIHIQEESMRAKQMLATMSHEIRSPLSGVVSMAEILSTTKLDKDQKQLLKIMLSSGDLVLQLINDILDLSKVESGVMKLEATKFRPREVVKHVLQTAAASLQKLLILEGHIADDVPIEVIGDVLRLRQILTNLISNAIKFTHEGKVGVRLYVVTEPPSITEHGSPKVLPDQNGTYGNDMLDCVPSTPVETGVHMEEKDESVVWIVCDVYDTGIGIPENAIPTLFKKYMQAGADTARKYGGTGLGLAICKQLVELMGGHLSVSSVENDGSTFTFVLPYKVSSISECSDDPDDLSDMEHQGGLDENDEDLYTGTFIFQPRMLGSMFSSQSSGRIQKLSPSSFGLNALDKFKRILEDSSSPTSNITYKELSSSEDANSSSTGHMDISSSHLETNISQNEQSHSFTNGHSDFHDKSMSRSSNNFDRTSVTSASQLVCQIGETRTDRTSECSSSSNSPENLEAKPKPKILLVEDNKINVIVAKSMMNRLGHTMDVVNNGAEAVQAVQKNIYDLILMDVCMPVMDGLQATRLIRSFEESGSWDEAVKAGIEQPSPISCSLEKPRQRLPIVAMTANSLSESADECYANGMDSFVSKPVTFQSLEQCLKRYITK